MDASVLYKPVTKTFSGSLATQIGEYNH